MDWTPVSCIDVCHIFLVKLLEMGNPVLVIRVRVDDLAAWSSPQTLVSAVGMVDVRSLLLWVRNQFDVDRALEKVGVERGRANRISSGAVGWTF